MKCGIGGQSVRFGFAVHIVLLVACFDWDWCVQFSLVAQCTLVEHGTWQVFCLLVYWY